MDAASNIASSVGIGLRRASARPRRVQYSGDDP